MIPLFDPLREMTLLSISLRMLLALLCGGLIGLEREYKRRPAGFRTHILICMGAAMTTLTSQYLSLCMGYPTDMARMGAQVVAGIGFIGAGTIIVTRHRRVKGLTTAAGLWTCAIVGLTIGAGFAEGGLVVTILMLLAELLFVRIEYRLLKSSHESIYFLEYTGKLTLDRVLGILQEQDVKVLTMEITRSEETAPYHANAIVSVRLNKSITDQRLTTLLSCVEGILSVEEI